MTKGPGIELEQRLKVNGVSLLGGIIFIAIMSFIFRHPDSAVGAFLLDRHTASLLYPVYDPKRHVAHVLGRLR